MFWLVCAVMTLATLLMVLSPMLRPSAPVAAVDERLADERLADETPDVAIYKAQLAEIDRDLARQVLSGDEAQRIRTEIARRLLSASQASARAVRDGPAALPAAVLAGLCVMGLAVGLYGSVGAPGYGDVPLQARLNAAEEFRLERPSQAEAEASARVLAAPDYPEDYLASVAQLRAMVPGRGDDLQGWELLAYHEARLRQFPAAAEAQARVLAIKGEEATAADHLRYAELLVAAADGYVSPEAEAVVRRVLNVAPGSIAARYYLGSMYEQTGRPDLAFRIWRPIVETGAPDQLYVALARQQVAAAAYRAGVEYAVPAAAPPPPPVMAAADLPGPSAEQMRAAESMEAEDRMAMIEGMVSGLSDRLSDEGGTASEWARLIRAYGVLNRPEEARAALSQARSVFQASPEALSLLNEAARTLPAAN